MKTQTALKWMELYNEKIQAKKDYLSELDTPIGDGDHGGNMARGMAAVMDVIEGKTFDSAGEVFKVVAMQLISKVGGASGPLYGSAFMGISKTLLDGGNLEEGLKAGLEMIQKRGRAEQGEKTMLDVWIPALEQLELGLLDLEMIKDLVDMTKDIKATKGRASYVGERSLGHIDPGAYSSGLLFEALLEADL